MSNVEGENPEFDDLDLGGLGLDPPEASDEFGDLSDLEATDDVLQPGGETLQTSEAEEGPAGDPSDLAPIEVKKDELEEPEEEEEEEEKGPGLLARLTQTSPYVVLLGISVVAMLIAILCLLLEWQRYDYQRKPPQVGAVTVFQSGPPSTTSAA